MIAFQGGHRRASGSRNGLCSDFGGLVRYLVAGRGNTSERDRVAWLAYRNLPGVDDPAGAVREMRALAALHPRLRWPAYHFGLSLHPDEHLSPERWIEAVDRVLRRLGLGEHQALVVAHRDTGHDHVHIAANRARAAASTWKTYYDGWKACVAIREIERDFGLTPARARDRTGPTFSSGAYHEAIQTARQPLASRAREHAAEFAAATGWHDLEIRLAAHGLRLEPARESGLMITDGRRAASLSHVDGSLSGPKLARRFGETYRDHRSEHSERPAVSAPEGTPAPPPGAGLDQRAAALLAGLTAADATFTEAHLRATAFYQPDCSALVDAALRSTEIVEIGRDWRGTVRYTTREYLGAESRLLAAAAALASRDALRLDPDATGRALDRAAPDLHAAGRAAVAHAATGSDFAQIVGGNIGDRGDRGDTGGRAAAAGALAGAYAASGFEVRGAALTDRGAAALGAATGADTRTLANHERAWAEGAGQLHPRAVLLLDEAGMVDARQLGRILEHAADRGAKVVLLGDAQQLQAIGAGDAFRGLLEQYPSASVDPPRRPHEPGRQPDLAEALARGGVAAALDACESASRLHWSDRHAGALAAILAAHAADRTRDPAASQLVVAHRSADAAHLNAALRAQRQAAGDLGPGVAAGSAELARGDRVLFLRGDGRGRDVANLEAAAVRGVRRGALGTVAAAEHHQIAVRLDDGRLVGFDPSRYDAAVHGYAATADAARQAIADRVYVLADPLLGHGAVRAALTRHRHSVDLFADRESFPGGREHLARALSRPNPKDLACDYAAADLRRAVADLESLAARISRATLEERPLRETLAVLAALRGARLELVACRRSLGEAARLLFADSDRALRRLLQDPQAVERVRRGELRRYGAPGAVMGAGARARLGAALPGRGAGTDPAAASLAGRFDAYRRSFDRYRDARQAALARPPVNRGRERPAPGAARVGNAAEPAAAAAGVAAGSIAGMAAGSTAGSALRRLPRAAEVAGELARVTAAIRTYQEASRGAQHAIEAAIRGMGRLALDSALLLLPPKVSIPVRLAVAAVSRAVDRGIDLALGRW